MNDPAKPQDDIEPPYPAQARTETRAEDLEKVLRLPLLSRLRDQGPDALWPASGSPRRDWSAALDLVNEAFEALRMTDERVAELEVQLEELTRRYNEEARAAQARLLSAESRTEEALTRARQQETRAKDAEARAAKAEASAREATARASEAEEWLARFHDAIVKGFSLRSTRSQAGTSASEREFR